MFGSTYDVGMTDIVFLAMPSSILNIIVPNRPYSKSYWQEIRKCKHCIVKNTSMLGTTIRSMADIIVRGCIMQIFENQCGFSPQVSVIGRLPLSSHSFIVTIQTHIDFQIFGLFGTTCRGDLRPQAIVRDTHLRNHGFKTQTSDTASTMKCENHKWNVTKMFNPNLSTHTRQAKSIRRNKV